MTVLIIIIITTIISYWYLYGNKLLKKINPLTPMNDQDRISPYNINTISNRQVMRINKNINMGISS